MSIVEEIDKNDKLRLSVTSNELPYLVGARVVLTALLSAKH
jgi:hypothetical protein